MTRLAPERLHDLLADRAIAPLVDGEAAELAALLAAHPDEDDLAFDRVAASVALGGLGAAIEPMPAPVRRRLGELGEAWVRTATPPATIVGRIVPDATAPSASSSARWVPWLVAAAAILIALVQSWPGTSAPPIAPRASALYADLAARPGTRTIAWHEPGADAVDHGDLVWNDAAQAGVMRLRGLPENDPAAIQYQLWIFDDSRAAYSENIAVDGGVFDVDAATGDVFVLVRPALEVGAPSLFAITTEPPGGVVKHNAEADPARYRIVLTAAVTG